MTCETIRLPGGFTAIVCSPRRRQPKCSVQGCALPGARQCDFPGPRGGTCDRYLCTTHAVTVGPDRDYCPHHQQQELSLG